MPSLLESFSTLRACALCKAPRPKATLQGFDGHLLCTECLRLARDEGLVLPADLETTSPSK